MPFPPNWPTYIPKGQAGQLVRTYVESMELNYWTGTEFESGSYENRRNAWTVVLAGPTWQQGARCIRGHVVLATASADTECADIPSLKTSPAPSCIPPI